MSRPSRQVEFQACFSVAHFVQVGHAELTYPSISAICDQAVLLPRRPDSRDAGVHLVADNRHNAFVILKPSDFT